MHANMHIHVTVNTIVKGTLNFLNPTIYPAVAYAHISQFKLIIRLWIVSRLISYVDCAFQFSKCLVFVTSAFELGVFITSATLGA